MTIEPTGEPVSDKPEIDFQRLELLEEIRHRAHSETVGAMEIYRQRAEERTERQQELRRLDESLQHSFGNRIPEKWAKERVALTAKVANADRRFADADKVRIEASERSQTAGRLYDRCIEWLKENRIEVPA